MDTICELVNVGKSYRGSVVIDNLSLQVRPGEMVAITGPSGSGKSTILNLIGLLDRHDRGRVSLFGTPAPGVGSRQARRLLRTRIGYLFQNYALIDNETVEANLQVAQRFAQRGGSSDRQAVLDRLGLAGSGERPVYTLSGGEQQRVAIARLMLKPCDLILADEPTGSLDAANRDEVLALLTELNSAGTTMVVVTHDPLVADRCNRTIELRFRSSAA